MNYVIICASNLNTSRVKITTWACALYYMDSVLPQLHHNLIRLVRWYFLLSCSIKMAMGTESTKATSLAIKN